jgi:hypothetical protein
MSTPPTSTTTTTTTTTTTATTVATRPMSRLNLLDYVNYLRLHMYRDKQTNAWIHETASGNAVYGHMLIYAIDSVEDYKQDTNKPELYIDVEFLMFALECSARHGVEAARWLLYTVGLHRNEWTQRTKRIVLPSIAAAAATATTTTTTTTTAPTRPLYFDFSKVGGFPDSAGVDKQQDAEQSDSSKKRKTTTK